ncbi:endonuclease/exonuclease/phosphatase family protein [Cryptosporidium muris RN66]|uniref:Endonuclease/exonuclease/phosphatase family protein n=1 Tax=Cryptosporidium muris (strain RN66) TaxID=441375 RepID=B6AIG4_CRYMR|nr:endonuclease/exonuclease/phosphatase family protein [Cryptosporidium muris RN66]EEA08005.1 endonuclease/exonuclease/phosphatase family protein [Cryptosporidium muris RN66]|eukprot:XP_002142354.1 endonuclease/exonuclease/phosphatase family protein [Cryptosporidium muris RN66]
MRKSSSNNMTLTVREDQRYSNLSDSIRIPNNTGSNSDKSAPSRRSDFIGILNTQPSLNSGITLNSSINSDSVLSAELYRCDLMYVSSRNKVPITPVESCELQPIVIVKDNLGRLWDDDDDNPDNPVVNGLATIIYRWSRGPSRAVCTFHPSQIATLQCAVTLRCFCSSECFKKGFNQLRRFYDARGMNPLSPHPNSHTYGVPCKPFQFNDPDNSLRDRDDAHITLLLRTGLVHLSENDEEWILVGDQRNYIPVPEDVGHQLRLEVHILSKNQFQRVKAANISNFGFISNNLGNSTVKCRSIKKDIINLIEDFEKKPGTYSCITTACCVPNLPHAPPRNILSIPTVTNNNHQSNGNVGSLASNSRFKVLSWNILAEIYASQEAFPHCDAYMLSWTYRKTRIIVEILSHQPDIVCLQEVQTEHFDDFFKPILQQYGYEGMYKQKTTEIFTSGSGRRKDGKYTMDGCATFYKTNKFIARENYSLEFSALIKEATHRTLPAEVKNNPAAIKRLLKDNVAVVILLEYRQSDGNNGSCLNSDNNNGKNSGNSCVSSNSTPLQVIIANTHIVANPEANDVKIWQAQTLVSVLEEYLHDCYRRQPVLPGLIICGDFNSTPDSALYRLLATGTCDRNHKDLAMDRHGLLADLPLGHSMRLRSAYSMARAVVEGHNPNIIPRSTETLEPLFTNYTPNYLGCLDYVFYTDERLRLGSILELLDEEALIKEASALQLPDWSLPNPQRPSDHLPLLTEFEWNN